MNDAKDYGGGAVPSDQPRRLPAALLIGLDRETAFIKVVGRANFQSGPNLKSAVNKLWEGGYHYFVLDLSGCLLMDSTFLGILASLGIKLQKQNSSPSDPRPIRLLNPNDRIAENLDTLGVAHLFSVLQGSVPDDIDCQSQPEAIPSREDLAGTSLEAHRALMKANPRNCVVFQDVAQLLEMELKDFEASARPEH